MNLVKSIYKGTFALRLHVLIILEEMANLAIFTSTLFETSGKNYKAHHCFLVPNSFSVSTHTADDLLHLLLIAPPESSHMPSFLLVFGVHYDAIMTHWCIKLVSMCKK